MSGTKSNLYAFEAVVDEGLGYAVQHYIDGSEFKDPTTARLWTEAAAALNALQAYLEEVIGEKL